MGRERTRGRSLAWRGTCALLLAACTGSIHGSEPPGMSPPPRPHPSDMPGAGGQPGPTAPGPAPIGAGRLRLLTRAQLESSLRDLLGDVPVGETEADTIAAGFASVGATYTTISPHGVEQYEAALLAALG